jgi:hypothetical protein
MRGAMLNQFDNLRLMFIELIEFQGRHAGALVGRFLPQLLEFVERLKHADASIRRYPDVIVARAFFGLFMSYAITVTILGGTAGFHDDPDDLAAFADIFLHGVLEAETKPSRRQGSPSARSSRSLTAGRMERVLEDDD